VRNAIVAVIGEIAAIDIPANAWNDLPMFILTLVKSNEPAHREVGYALFGTLCQTVGEQMRKNIGQLMAVFSTGLADKNNNVRLSTLRAIQALVTSVDEDTEAETVMKLLPQIVAVARECALAGNEEAAQEALQIFTALAELVCFGCCFFVKKKKKLNV